MCFPAKGHEIGKSEDRPLSRLPQMGALNPTGHGSSCWLAAVSHSLSLAGLPQAPFVMEVWGQYSEDMET